MQNFDFDLLNPDLRTVGINRQWERGINCDLTVCCDEYQVLHALKTAPPHVIANLYTRPMYSKKYTARTLQTATDLDIGGSLAIRVAASFKPKTIILAGYDAHRLGRVDKWVPSPRTGNRGPRSLNNWHTQVNSAIAENPDIKFIWANNPREYAEYCYA